VMSWMVLSLKVPVAVNCLVVPTAMLEPAGVTAIETRVAPVTVRVAVPVTEPDFALMVEEPTPTPLARPAELMVAMAGADEVHVTEVRTCVLPSSKLPIAVNCWVVPAAIDAVPTAIEAAAGVTSMEIKFAGTTVRVVVSVSDPRVAVRVVLPAARVVASPELLTVAVDANDELQVTPLTRSCVDPSMYVAVTVYC
jgi:hypothetical protein